MTLQRKMFVPALVQLLVLVPVLAEEAPNLATRSAEAAKNTASMIHESIGSVRSGVDIASEVGKVLEQIVESVGKTADLVSEIAAASQEQTQGIGQVNTPVSQMDKVTQQNAANAEPSAGASGERSSHAESTNEIVGELIALVGGANGATAPQGQRHGIGGRRRSHADHTYDNIAGDGPKKAHMPSSRLIHEKAIPLDHDGGPDSFHPWRDHSSTRRLQMGKLPIRMNRADNVPMNYSAPPTVLPRGTRCEAPDQRIGPPGPDS
jgi:hypothetical protein